VDVERVQQQPCFVLHHRAYKNTSLIVDLITRDYGRISLVAKAAKQAKSPLKCILHTFQPLNIAWVRRSELGTLTAAEFSGTPLSLLQDRLYAALYLNEIMIRLLAQYDPVQDIFFSYENALQKLHNNCEVEIVLREFEKALLQSLGYEISLSEEADTHLPIQRDEYYHYLPEYGFTKADPSDSEKFLFKGEHLLAFNENCFSEKAVLKAAQRITYITLKKLLGDKPLKSRELIMALKSV